MFTQLYSLVQMGYPSWWMYIVLLNLGTSCSPKYLRRIHALLDRDAFSGSRRTDTIQLFGGLEAIMRQLEVEEDRACLSFALISERDSSFRDLESAIVALAEDLLFTTDIDESMISALFPVEFRGSHMRLLKSFIKLGWPAKAYMSLLKARSSQEVERIARGLEFILTTWDNSQSDNPGIIVENPIVGSESEFDFLRFRDESFLNQFLPFFRNIQRISAKYQLKQTTDPTWFREGMISSFIAFQTREGVPRNVLYRSLNALERCVDANLLDDEAFNEVFEDWLSSWWYPDHHEIDFNEVLTTSDAIIEYQPQNLVNPVAVSAADFGSPLVEDLAPDSIRVEALLLHLTGVFAQPIIQGCREVMRRVRQGSRQLFSLFKWLSELRTTEPDSQGFINMALDFKAKFDVNIVRFSSREVLVVSDDRFQLILAYLDELARSDLIGGSDSVLGNFLLRGVSDEQVSELILGMRMFMEERAVWASNLDDLSLFPLGVLLKDSFKGSWGILNFASRVREYQLSRLSSQQDVYDVVGAAFQTVEFEEMMKEHLIRRMYLNLVELDRWFLREVVGSSYVLGEGFVYSLQLMSSLDDGEFGKVCMRMLSKLKTSIPNLSKNRSTRLSEFYRSMQNQIARPNEQTLNKLVRIENGF